MSAEQYVEHVFLTYIKSAEFDGLVANRWMPREELEATFPQGVRLALEKKGFDVGNRYDEIAQRHLDRMFERGVVQTEGDDYTGYYVKLPVGAKDDYAQARIEEGEVSQRVMRLGDGALSRALDKISEAEDWGRIEIDEDTVNLNAEIDQQNFIEENVPASDRVVRLDDNSVERDAIVEKLDELSTAVRGHNDEDKKLGGDRDRLLAELRSGRELLSAPSVRVRALAAVLGTVLAFFATEFAGGLIGELASMLLEALKPLLGL